MGEFTFIPIWVIQDALIFLMTAVTIIFIIKKEEHPAAFLTELFCFTILYAAVYENFATLMGWYGYGRSLIMIFNVPLSVPLVEYLVIYAVLRLLGSMDVPFWTKPFIVGVSGMLFDFSLDPLAVRQVFSTKEAFIGRWTWFISPGDVNIFGIPVYNFSGWMILCGYAAVFLLLGRWWFRRSGFKPAVGYMYPLLAMLAALATLVSPLSQMLLWLAPVFSKGGAGEWIMLIAHFSLSALFLLFFFWRGRMKTGFSFRENIPVFLILIGFPLSNILFALIGGFYEICMLQLLVAAVESALVLFIYFRGRPLLKTGHKRESLS
jgi:hypothetical protein